MNYLQAEVARVASTLGLVCREAQAADSGAYGDTLSEPQVAAQALWEVFPPNPTVEYLVVQPANQKLCRLGPALVFSRGEPGAVQVDARAIFKTCLMRDASAAFLGHNHPSGDIKPSPEDTALLRVLRETGKELGCRILDFFIFGKDRAHSMTQGVEIPISTQTHQKPLAEEAHLELAAQENFERTLAEYNEIVRQPCEYAFCGTTCLEIQGVES